jgi:MoxR-like ATPase
VMENRARGHTPELLGAVLGCDDVLRLIETAREIFVAPALRRYIVSLSAATRDRAELRLGVSPRGSIALEAAAKVRAAADGRPFVTADDVKALAQPVLAHRLLLRPEAELDSAKPATIIESILGSVPVPRGRGDEGAP